MAIPPWGLVGNLYYNHFGGFSKVFRSDFSAGCSGWKIRDWLGWAEWRGGKGGDKSRHIHRLFKVFKKIEIYADGNMEGIVVQWRER